MRRRLELIILIAVIITGLFLTHIYVSFFSAPPSPSAPSGTPVSGTLTVTKGMTFRGVALALEEAGVIRDSRVLLLVGNILGAHKKIKAGEYEFAGGMNLIEVLDMLVKGRVKSYSITIPEGHSINEIAGILQEAGLLDS